ncbi:biopolymer transporter ExbD [Niastella koreensis]|uniref:Outer membrane transport energization protein ExbD n=2 Tax=Niastella koreensis TaxID=354356 RepID=G8TKZ0_NIAKG|nr:biopolymer transporter ExbD [Niastella koreensis]AEW00829.1 outer membrane transport energization protein ExbD [Niastella koreensis GR20-10]OQP42442.1 biopolymer transporter ExbD [Niastella koreensis]
MNLRRRLKGHPELHAGALNDILFILLFFFLIVSTLANPNVIKLSQPKAKSDTKAKQTVIVNIKPTGEYIINGKQITIEEMKAFMQPYVMKDSSQATIAINADKTVPLEDVVAVMRVARELGARSTLLVDTKVK